MTILITGTEGFIAKKLYERIRRNTPHDIVTFDTRVDTNRTKLYQEFDVIYHLGAISDTRCMDKERIYENNIEITKLLIDIQRNVDKPAFFSFASSASVYGSAEEDQPFDETSKVLPASYYAKSKYACELLLELSGIPYNNLRLFNVFSADGVSEAHKVGHASPHFTFMKQNPIRIFEGSECVMRDFIHVDDVVESFIRLTGKEGTFNIGTGVPTSFRKIAEQVSDITGAAIEEVPFPEHLASSYQWFTCSSRSFRTITNNP